MTERGERYAGAFSVGFFLGLLGLGRVGWGIIIGLALCSVYAAWETGAMKPAAIWMLNLLRRLWARLRQVKPEPKNPWAVVLGRNRATGEKIAPDLRRLGSVGIYCLTRFGKTTLLHAVLVYLIKNFRPHQLQLVIVDPEEFDYRIFSGVPHLALPIARTEEDTTKVLAYLQKEMDRRGELFRQVPAKHLCNSIGRYTKLNHELELRLPDLPYILVVIDEAQDVIQPGTEAEKVFIRVAKRGQKRGILLWAATQRPTSDVMTGHVKGQFTARFIGHMADTGDYYRVHNIPKTIYQDMERRRGLFMFYHDGQWSFLQGVMVPDQELERVAARVSKGHPAPTWPVAATSHVIDDRIPLKGSMDEKRQAVFAFLSSFAEKPITADFLARFDVSETTARRWIDRVWPDVEKSR